MHLEIDMGNTRIKWRLRDGSTILVRGAEQTNSEFTSMESILRVYKKQIHAIWVVSVVGSEIEKKLNLWMAQFLPIKPVFARSCEFDGGVKNGYESPERLGVDRWLALLAVHRLTKNACVIVSCGTAMTVDLLSRTGQHQGGYIVPGMRLMLGAINSGARLININKEQFPINLLPGRSTADAVFAGLSSMLSGVIENGIKQLSAQDNEKIELIFTGGDADKLLPLYPDAHVVPELVLDGLVCVNGHLFPME